MKNPWKHLIKHLFVLFTNKCNVSNILELNREGNAVEEIHVRLFPIPEERHVSINAAIELC